MTLGPLLLWAAGCTAATSVKGCGARECDYDGDGDGYTVRVVYSGARPGDCLAWGQEGLGPDFDDESAENHAGADEICDGRDNDGDGSRDEGVTSTWFADADGDGYGDAAVAIESCGAPPSGYLSVAGDCDDTTPAANPGMAEVCDGLDNDCDGLLDEPDAVGAATWYADADGDGYGDPAQGRVACEAPEGCVADGTDCADWDTEIHPGAADGCDGDGEDDDCDGIADEDATIWFYDSDGDGYGGTRTVASCVRPNGTSREESDCDDANADVHPGAPDQDCEGTVDYNCDGSNGSSDGDGDRFPACEDCDDRDPAVNPSATEIRDAIDNDCDGFTDEDFVAEGDLLVTELMIDPDGSDESFEWFEVYNNAGTFLRLGDGWRIGDGQSEVIALDGLGILLAPEEYAVLGVSAGAVSGALVHIYSWAGFALAQDPGGTDTVSIVFDDGTSAVDVATLTFCGRFAEEYPSVSLAVDPGCLADPEGAWECSESLSNWYLHSTDELWRYTATFDSSTSVDHGSPGVTNVVSMDIPYQGVCR